MEGKMVYGTVTSVALMGLLGYAWTVGQDGTVTAAVIGLIGMISGAILGFQFAKGQ